MAGTRKAGSTRKAAAAQKPRWRRVVRKVLVRGALTGLVLVLIAAGGFVYLYQTIDIPDPNAEFQTETSFVYYDGGTDEIGRFATQDRVSIPLDQMPDSIKDAVVAAENRSFYTDNGIDPKGILRAAFSNASGNSTQGASTITQQYVKLLYLSQERSYTRKVKEAILSLKVQRQQSKAEVLEGYLNTVYFGRGAYGVEAAANAFFNRSAADLSLRQSAVLAAVVNNPTRFDPDNGPDSREALRGRYRYVLSSMADIDAISDEEAAEAAQRLPKFPRIAAESAYGGQRGHVLTMVRSELRRLGFGDDQIDGGGLRVTTTFTEKAMTAAEEGVEEVRPDVPKPKQLHMAAATVEPGTGAVKGLYAGQDYLDSQLNWAVEGGQAGSTFKAFAVAAALEDGYSLNSDFDGDSPLTLPDGTEFENQGDRDYGGAVSLQYATQQSINTAFIDLTNSMDDGPRKIIKTAVKMGIPPEGGTKDGTGFPSATGGLEPILGVALGSQTVSPVNMANGYATIANGGVAAEPFIIERVESRDGAELYSHDRVTDRALSEDIASDVSYALQQVVSGGSGTAALDLDRPAAGKTGTATKTGGAVSSSWFAGFTPQLSTAVMMVRGKGNGQLDGWIPGSDGYFGGNYPARAWTAIMSRDMEGVPEEEFPEPAFVDGEKDGSSGSSDDDGGYVPPDPEPSQPPRDDRPTREPEPDRKPSRTPSPSTPAPTEPAPTEPSTPAPGDPGAPIPVPVDPGGGGGNGGGGGGGTGGGGTGGGGTGGGGTGGGTGGGATGGGAGGGAAGGGGGAAERPAPTPARPAYLVGAR